VSLPALLVAFLVVTVLAMDPQYRVDRAVDGQWAHVVVPQWRGFFQDVLDRIAGQSVDAPILVIVAVLVAQRYWTWRPLLVAAAVEAGFYAFIGLAKLAFARPAPVQGGDPGFFHGGLLRDGWEGISFPSGHTAESVLVYGAIVYLLAAYTRTPRWAVRVLVGVVVLIALNAAFTSFFLGWHWPTDLVGGWLAGAIVLRVVILLDRRLTRRRGDRPEDRANDRPGNPFARAR
jgi:membrane-associated phospholipid phosphatase